MLEIHIPEQELFDDDEGTFLKVPETSFQIEHSLLSIKKWESKWHKPFLSKKDKTVEEMIDYIRCMTLDSDVDPIVYRHIPTEELEKIIEYIQDPMTATWFSKHTPAGPGSQSGDVITNEIVYYWMIELGIPIEFQKWHLEQLMTLIRVVTAKRAPKKKMSQKEAIEQQRALNAQRKAKLKSNG